MEHPGWPAQFRRLLDGVLAISSDLDPASVLRRIVATATELVDASFGALGVLDPSGTYLSEFITVGVSDEERAAIGHPPEGHGILGLLIVDPQPLRLRDLHQHPERFGFPANHPSMTSFLGVPITMRGEVFGNLYLCDKVAGGSFTDFDEHVAVTVAGAAGIAIDNARLHARVAELATLEDRERIARELHDNVMQRLFAISLSLQAGLTARTDPVAAARITAAVTDLDRTVQDVRGAIFELHTVRFPGRSVREELLQIAAESARALCFEPDLRFEGPIDTDVSDETADELCSVLREALSNVAKHAQATWVTVLVQVRHGVLSARITDDGVGFDPVPSGGRGISNLHARARRLGGSFNAQRLDTGTELVWSVPLHL